MSGPAWLPVPGVGGAGARAAADPGTAELARVPATCSLPSAEQPLRVAEFDDLFATVARPVERLGPTRVVVAFAAAPGRAAAVADLARRETECCAFFTFAVTEGPDGVVLLDVTVPPTHADVLVALAARAERLGTRPAAPGRVGTDPTGTPEPGERAPVVLYACVHNSGRSVAALHLTRCYAGGRVDARSAGSEPGAGVDPAVVAVLAERGVDTTGHAPAPLADDAVADADVVVTMGCGETCPVVPGTRSEDWPIDDPADQDLPTVRRIVDGVDARVRALLADLGVPVAAAT